MTSYYAIPVTPSVDGDGDSGYNAGGDGDKVVTGMVGTFGMELRTEVALS